VVLPFGVYFFRQLAIQLAKSFYMVENAIEKVKLNKWYGIVLYIGILAAAASLLNGNDLLSRKHLMGLGLGCIFVGLSFFIAERRENYQADNGILFRDITKHTWITIPILLCGIFLIGFFGIKIFKELQ
jgi:hypothetical protein